MPVPVLPSDEPEEEEAPDVGEPNLPLRLPGGNQPNRPTVGRPGPL